MRYIPGGWGTYHPSTNYLVGTETYGNPLDMSQPWSIIFNNLVFDMFMFTTNNLAFWTCMDRSIFTWGNWIPSSILMPNFRSSITPTSPGESYIRMKSAWPSDPAVEIVPWI